jgi:hypothetical protein
MGRLGDPTTEAALATASERIEEYNALALRLVAETSGVGRAMGDSSKVVASLTESIRKMANQVVVSLAALKDLLRQRED